MALPGFSVGGLASRLDTGSMITQLMNAERAPVTRLQERKAGYQQRVDAWQSIRTRLSSLRTAVDTVKTATAFDKLAKATSSDDAVTVSLSSSTGTAEAGSVSFRVQSLAARHQLAGAGTYGSQDALVGAGTVTLSIGGTDHTVTTTATTTLADVARDVNGRNLGVKASMVGVGASGYRLILSADKTGAAAAFSASGTQAGLASFDLVEQGTDAKLVIGSGAGALTVERSSNTITDLIPGATLTLEDTTTAPVTVEIARDVDGAVGAVKSLVNELNKSVGTIADLTAYDASTKKAGKLQGEQAAWQVANSLRAQVSALSAGGVSAASAASIGITLARDGTFTVNEAQLRKAFETDFEGTAAVLGRSGSSADSRVEFVRASEETVAGAYAVAVSAAATQPGVTGAAAYTPPVADDAFTVTKDGKTANVVVTAGSDLPSALSQINSALASAGITTVSATDDGGAIRLQDSRYGSAVTFTVAGGAVSGGLAGTYAGTDVAGTIGGVAATGSGQALTAQSGPAKGLQVKVTATQASIVAAGGWLPLGSPVYEEGIAGRISRYLATAEGLTGIVSTASNRWASQIKIIDNQISAYDLRLDQREALLRKQFTTMETAMSSLQKQSQWLSSQT